jgi:anthranilate phosphoribosyltransferase
MSLLELLPGMSIGAHLTREQACLAMDAITSGTEPASRIASFLAFLRLRGPLADELAGFADSLLAKALPFPLPDGLTVDTCGTGGDGKNTFNISTTAALVVAACGVQVVKHGNRSASGRCGSADLLEGLEIAIDLPRDHIVEQLRATGFGFLFAPTYHPVLRHVAPVRRELGFATVFNVLGPMLNPARVKHQLLGVFEPRLLGLLSGALALRGCEHAYVVHGEGGFDEATPCGPVAVHEVVGAEVREWPLDPRELGFARCSPGDLEAWSKEDSVRVALNVLSGRPSPHLDAVLLNAALALRVSGGAADLAEAASRAREAVTSGRAMQVVTQLQGSRRVARS